MLDTEVFRANANVTTLLDPHIELHPDHAAFRELKAGEAENIEETSYLELGREVERKVMALENLGVKAGDRVLILVPMSTALYSTLLAILRTGAVALFIDPSMKKSTMHRLIKSADLKAVVATTIPATLISLFPSIRNLEVKILEDGYLPSWKSFKNSPGREVLGEAREVPEDHPALITFTSGTSGSPKEIVRSHRFLRTQLNVLKRELQMKKETVELTALPMFVLANLAHGATTVISSTDLSKPGKAEVGRIAEELIETGATSLLGSPALVERLVEHCLKKSIEIPGIRTIFTGGGCVDHKLLEKAKVCLPGARLTIVYGSSEVEPISHQNFSDTNPTDNKLTEDGAGHLVGYPLRDLVIKILHDDSLKPMNRQEKRIASLQNMDRVICGEIVVSGDHVVSARDPDQKRSLRMTGRTFHRTGDYGYLDSFGRLWITGLAQKNDPDLRFSFALEERIKTQLERATGKRPDKIACLGAPGDQTILYLENDYGKKLTEADLNLPYITETKLVAKIPVDPRHNTKILYGELSGLGRSLLGRFVELRDQGFIFRLFESINLRSRNAHGS